MTAPSEAAVQLEVVPLRHPLRWVFAAVLTIVVLLLAISVYTNKNIDHRTIDVYLLSGAILAGLETTIVLAVISQALGIGIGVVLAIMRLSGSRILETIALIYVWALRGTPLLVQILIWGNLGILFATLGLSIPFLNVTLVSVPTASVLTVFVASVIALATSEGAYMAEIIRAGILSVGAGQREAALALGMTSSKVMRRIILPQALRVSIPPTGNEFISMLKNTSLVSVISGGDLLTRAQNISAQNFRVIELLLVATAWYLVLTTLATLGQRRVEQWFGRSEASSEVRRPWLDLSLLRRGRTRG
jgi:polar amino acid transport system permease protein